MIYGYARVSTTGQALNGTSLEAQECALREAGAVEVYKDAYTGKTADRPALNRLLERLQPGDRLIVTKLDRLSRTVADGLEIINSLMNKGVSVHILNMGLIDNTPTGEMIYTIFLAFAQFERSMILERTQSGKARKRAEGTLKEGRPPKNLPEFEMYRQMVKDKKISMSEACRRLGITQPTWYARIRKLEKEEQAE